MELTLPLSTQHHHHANRHCAASLARGEGGRGKRGMKEGREADEKVEEKEDVRLGSIDEACNASYTTPPRQWGPTISFGLLLRRLGPAASFNSVAMLWLFSLGPALFRLGSHNVVGNGCHFIQAPVALFRNSCFV